MNTKLIGALLIVMACGGFGFLLALHNKKEIRMLRELDMTLEYMIQQLQYRQLSLPELCSFASEQTNGFIGKFFEQLATELNSQILPDVSQCIHAAINKLPGAPAAVGDLLALLGTNLGKFDLEGQISGLYWVQDECRRRFENRSANQEVRRRCYQTLGLCVGAALAIIFV